MFGGRTISKPLQLITDMYRYDIATNEWSIIDPSTNPPSPRYYHAMINVGDNIFVFGGLSSTSEPLGDLWLYVILLLLTKSHLDFL